MVRELRLPMPLLLPGREPGRGKLDEVGLSTRLGRRRGMPSVVLMGATVRGGDVGGLDDALSSAESLLGRAA